MSIQKNEIPFTKLTQIWIIDLNVKCKTLKLLEDQIGKNLDDLGCGKDHQVVLFVIIDEPT